MMNILIPLLRLSHSSYSLFSLVGSTRTPDREKQSCKGEGCESSKTAFDYIVFSVIGVVGVLGGVLCVCSMCNRESTPSARTGFDTVPTTEMPMSDNPTNNIPMNNANIFQSGTWSSRYFQYGKWHGQHEFLLSFDANSLTVNGHGKDDVGSYTITGQYSTQSNEIELIKKYQEATGDFSENLGHDVTIEVTWNSMKHLFEGKWYVDTPEFTGEDTFELTFKQSLELLMNQTYNHV
jgi:hypothetical protein